MLRDGEVDDAEGRVVFVGVEDKRGGIEVVFVGWVDGGAIMPCCDVRLEVVLELRRGDTATGLGEGGTEFRSGAIFEGSFFVFDICEMSLCWETTRGRMFCVQIERRV